MFSATLLLIVGTLGASSPAGADAGVIEGIVSNGSRGHQPVAGVEVALRVRVERQFVGLARTTSGTDGAFRFDNLPTDLNVPYLPGASRGDVHFPGPRISLTPDRPRTSISLTVFDSISKPNPLHIEMLDITVDTQPGVLRVRESMLIKNPTRQCYVGSAMHQGGAPVTLHLTIPPDFERVTFDDEALGRRFSLVNEKLVTGIPWPPGNRQVNYTYVIASEHQHRVWQRSVDLPCSKVRVTVRADDPEAVSANLPNVGVFQEDRVTFESNQEVPAEHVLRLELGRLPVPIMTYARRIALLILAALVLSVCLVSVRHAVASPRGRRG